jgi:1,4-alpha-glucan branching enzyme
MVESGQRFLPLDDTRSVHDLYRICSTGHPEAGTSVIFTRDTDTTMRVWSGTYGYPGEGNYLEFHKKYHNSGHRYWAVTDSKADLGAKRTYHPDWVEEKVRGHARHFATIVEQEMWKFHASTGRHGTLAAPFDTELFGHWWFEGPDWLAGVYRSLAREDRGIRPATASRHLAEHPAQQPIAMPPGSWGANGDFSMWIGEATAWTWERVWALEDAFWESVPAALERPAARPVLAQAAREMLLAQASDWQFIISTGAAADYAERRLRQHCDDAEDLLAALAPGAESRLAQAQATADELHRRDDLFPDILSAVAVAASGSRAPAFG